MMNDESINRLAAGALGKIGVDDAIGVITQLVERHQWKGPEAAWCSIHVRHLATVLAALADATKPVDMLLYCPQCFEQHIDEPQPERQWDNPPHRSHECQFCGHVWRPADVPTNGVRSTQTKGKVDGSPRPIAFANGDDFKKSLADATARAERAEKALREIIEWENALEIESASLKIASKALEASND